MVNPLNGSGSSQTSIVNPFQQRQNQLVPAGDRNTEQTGRAVQTTSTQKQGEAQQASRALSVASASGQDNKPRAAQNRGSVVDITV